MKRAMVNMLRYERSGKGLNYSNLREIYYGYRVFDSFYMFVSTFILYFLLGIYLTNVLKPVDHDDSVSLPWYYPFTKSYWINSEKGGK